MVPKASERQVRKFSVYDLEWSPGTMQVRVVGVYDGENYRAYRSVVDFINNEFTVDTHGRWFFAHAGGVADYSFLHERFLTDNRFSVTGCSSGSSAMIVNVRRGRHSWKLIDSFRLLPDALSRIGKSIGMEKGGPTDEMAEDERREWFSSVSLSELISYNENDCRILWHAIDRFENELLELGGQLQMTLAGCSLELFRRKYLKSELPKNFAVNEWSRQAYIASRVEVFQRRATDCHYWDINSSFPASMTLPLPGQIKTCTVGRLPDSGIYLADVEVSVPKDCPLPPLPYRASNRIFFPTGKWRSYFFWVDILTLLEAGGTIEKVYDVVHFEPFEDCALFALDLYAKRQKAEGFQKYLYKILLNSLYGKFAESTKKERWHVNPDSKNLERLACKAAGGPNRSSMYMPGLWQETITVRLEHEHVALSAAITAWSRRALYLYMQGRDCYYCDTDGFAIPKRYKLDRVGSGLGDLKLEKIVKAADFIAPKVYRLEMEDGTKIHKAKGFSLKQAQKRENGKLVSLTEATAFEHIMEGREIELIRMMRLKESMSRAILGPEEHKVTKRLRSVFPKRCFFEDGSSRPWSVKEIDQRLKGKR